MNREIDEEADALLAAYRQHSVSPTQLRGIADALFERASPPPLAEGVSAGAWSKVLVIGIVGVAAAIAVVASRTPRSAEVAVRVGIGETTADRLERFVRTRAAVDAPATGLRRSGAPAQAVHAEPARPDHASARGGGRARPNAASAAPSTKSPPRPMSTLTEELRLIRSAKRDLEAGRAHAVLQAVDAYVDRFPHGDFAAEASALRVAALCRLGQRDAADRALREMTRRFPGHALLPRARRECARNPRTAATPSQ